jgi:hypothetical protein
MLITRRLLTSTHHWLCQVTYTLLGENPKHDVLWGNSIAEMIARMVVTTKGHNSHARNVDHEDVTLNSLFEGNL